MRDTAPATGTAQDIFAGLFESKRVRSSSAFLNTALAVLN
jgi:hypothetical protein